MGRGAGSAVAVGVGLGALMGLAALGACGGTSANPPGSDGGSSGSSGGGASSGGAGSSSSGASSSGGGGVCPQTEPTSGAACDEAIACQYGTDPDLDCDTTFTCNGQTWAESGPSPGGPCPTSSPGANGCPSSYGAVPVGQGCSGSAECAYPQGRCACVPPSGPVVRLDGGSLWTCESPAAGCPEPRPTLGSSCSTAGQSCDYGSCDLPGGVELLCSGGVWTKTFAACPL